MILITSHINEKELIEIKKENEIVVELITTLKDRVLHNYVIIESTEEYDYEALFNIAKKKTEALARLHYTSIPAIREQTRRGAAI